MWSWLRELCGAPRPSGAPAPGRPAAAASPAPLRPRVRPTPAAAAPPDPGTLLSRRLVSFLEEMTSPAEPMAAEDLSEHDVLFLEGLIRRLEAAQLEVAMLPDVTVRLTDMLRRGDVPIAQYASLINHDASLSVEVLKAANSAFYAGSARTTTLNEAIMRIGLNRLQSIMMLTLLKSRVLRAGALRDHAELLIDMSMPLASLAGAVARAMGGPVDLCFMRGMLLHVEHLMVLGTIGDTSREHRAIITPSSGALILAFVRSGPDVRCALAHGWGLEDIMLRRDDDGDPIDYAALRVALVCRWLGRPLPPVASLPADLLEDVLSHVPPRVTTAHHDEDDGERASA